VSLLWFLGVFGKSAPSAPPTPLAKGTEPKSQPTPAVKKTEGTPPETAWKEYTFEDGKCKLSFPTAPAKTEPTKADAFTKHECTFGNLRFALMYRTLVAVEVQQGAKSFLANQELLSNPETNKYVIRRLSVKNITLDGHPGLETVVQVPDETGSKLLQQAQRTFVVGDRLYYLIVIETTPDPKTSQSLANRFFDTFQLLK
jgi:hypothetical protein